MDRRHSSRMTPSRREPASRITIPVQTPHPDTADRPIPEPRRIPGIKDVLAKSLPRREKAHGQVWASKDFPADKLRTVLGVADVAFKQNEQRIAIIDTPLQA